jgi:hypothetical protein
VAVLRDDYRPVPVEEPLPDEPVLPVPGLPVPVLPVPVVSVPVLPVPELPAPVLLEEPLGSEELPPLDEPVPEEPEEPVLPGDALLPDEPVPPEVDEPEVEEPLPPAEDPVPVSDGEPELLVPVLPVLDPELPVPMPLLPEPVLPVLPVPVLLPLLPPEPLPLWANAGPASSASEAARTMPSFTFHMIPSFSAAAPCGGAPGAVVAAQGFSGDAAQDRRRLCSGNLNSPARARKREVAHCRAAPVRALSARLNGPEARERCSQIARPPVEVACAAGTGAPLPCARAAGRIQGVGRRAMG